MARWTKPSLLRLLAPLGAVVLVLGLLARSGAFTSRRPTAAASSGVVQLPVEPDPRQKDLDRLVADMHARFAAKQEAVQALLAGRSTLKQTVARFRTLNTSHLVDGNQLSDEALCRDVLIHAGYLLRDRDDATDVLESIRRQVREHLPALEAPRR